MGISASVDLRGHILVWEVKGSSREDEVGKLKPEGQMCNSSTEERERSGCAEDKREESCGHWSEGNRDFVCQEVRGTCAACWTGLAHLLLSFSFSVFHGSNLHFPLDVRCCLPHAIAT